MNELRNSGTKYRHVLWLAVLASGCLTETRVGTSGEASGSLSATPAPQPTAAEPLPPPGAAAEPASAAAPPEAESALPPSAAHAAAPRSAPARTKFTGDARDLVGGNQFIAGDLDGDGFHDIVLLASRWIDSSVLEQAEREHPDDWQELTGFGDYTAYVFYGRSNFPERLALQDADAIIEGKLASGRPLGDVNDDGLADFVLQGSPWVQIVFGAASRLQGRLAVDTLGTRWEAALAPRAVANERFPLIEVKGAGDVDGDGSDDLLVNMWTQVIQESFARDFPSTWATPTDLLSRAYLVRGHTGAWSSGRFDKAWATAEFAAPSVNPGGPTVLPPDPMAAGDLDGDGYADLLASEITDGWSTQRIFYGGPNKLTGTLGSAQADAVTPLPVPMQEYTSNFAPIGDLDADGRTELATMNPNGMHVYYGRSIRWSGTLAPEGELVIKTQRAVGMDSTQAADVDGDGHPDLVVGGTVEGADRSGALYLVRGTEERLTGSLTLTDSQIIARGTSSEDLTGRVTGDILGYAVHVNGDVDGDGKDDILAGAPGSEAMPPRGYALLIPSSPATPQ